MPDVIPGSDINVAVGPAIGVSTSPVSIASGDRLIINAGIDITSDSGDAVAASFAALDVDVDGTIFGEDGGVFLNDTTGVAAFAYTFDIGATGDISAGVGQGIFAGSTAAGSPVSGSLATVSNAGTVSSMGFEGIRLQTVDFGTINNTGTITTVGSNTFRLNAVTFGEVENADVTNSGTIRVIDSGSPDVDDLELAALAFSFSTENVTLNNSGTIEGLQLSVTSDATVSEDITNSGTLEGDVVLSDTVGGTFVNTETGVINGTLRAFGGNDVIENNGTHNGSVTLGSGNDTYTGTATIAGQVNGGGGDDTIFGSGGNDSIVGRSGNDELRGREGNDFINGDAGNDFIAGGGGDDELRGGSGDDTVNGASGNDILSGGGGNDFVGGGAGDDFIQGASGADELVGGDGNDFVGGGGNNDILFGRDGEDTLRGSDGNDLLVGGADADLLVGGSGNDTFQWRDITDSGTDTPSADVVRDFGDGADLLDISDLAGDAFVFITSGGFTGSGVAEVRVSISSGGDSFVRLDANGDGDWDMQFIVEDTTDLAANDFIL